MQGDTHSRPTGAGGCRRFLSSSLLFFILLTLCHQQRLFVIRRRKALQNRESSWCGRGTTPRQKGL